MLAAIFRTHAEQRPSYLSPNPPHPKQTNPVRHLLTHRAAANPHHPNPGFGVPFPCEPPREERGRRRCAPVHDGGKGVRGAARRQRSKRGHPEGAARRVRFFAYFLVARQESQSPAGANSRPAKARTQPQANTSRPAEDQTTMPRQNTATLHHPQRRTTNAHSRPEPKQYSTA